MVCKNCGAVLEDNVLQCPFCQSENSELSQKNYEKEVGDIIGRIQNVKEETKEEGRKISKKSGKVFTVSIIILIGLILISYAVSEIAHVIGENRNEKIEEAFLTKLNEYYQKANYEGLYKYYYDKNVYSVKAVKYQEVISAWSDMDNIRLYKEYTGSGRYVFPINIYAILEEFNNLCKLTEEKTNDNAVHGNEQVLLGFKAEAEEFLNKTLGMTEIEIEAVKKVNLDQTSSGKNETLLNMTQEICSRLGIKDEY